MVRGEPDSSKQLRQGPTPRTRRASRPAVPAPPAGGRRDLDRAAAVRTRKYGVLIRGGWAPYRWFDGALHQDVSGPHRRRRCKQGYRPDLVARRGPRAAASTDEALRRLVKACAGDWEWARRALDAAGGDIPRALARAERRSCSQAMAGSDSVGGTSPNEAEAWSRRPRPRLRDRRPEPHDRASAAGSIGAPSRPSYGFPDSAQSGRAPRRTAQGGGAPVRPLHAFVASSAGTLERRLQLSHSFRALKGLDVDSDVQDGGVPRGDRHRARLGRPGRGVRAGEQHVGVAVGVTDSGEQSQTHRQRPQSGLWSHWSRS